jgi:hypothetical protein
MDWKETGLMEVQIGLERLRNITKALSRDVRAVCNLLITISRAAKESVVRYRVAAAWGHVILLLSMEELAVKFRECPSVAWVTLQEEEHQRCKEIETLAVGVVIVKLF